MNLPLQVDGNDFIFQSIQNWSKVPKKDCYVLIIKSYQCIHCIEYMPIYEQFALQHPNVGFLVLEATTNSALLQQWQELVSPMFIVNGYPTVVMYKANGHPDHVVNDRLALPKEIKMMML